MQIEEIVKACLIQITGGGADQEKITLNTSLAALGINSFSFIQTLVAIETELEIIFPDELLVFSKDGNVNCLVEITTDVYQKKYMGDVI